MLGQLMSRLFSYLRPHLWLFMTAAILWIAVYGVFNSGRFMTCFWGLMIAITMFWMRSKHLAFYGFTEIVAGLFTLAQNYSVGRGGFSAIFAEAYQTFQGYVVLVSTLGAVYVMVRGIDNLTNGIAKRNG
jgi:hypothetical protein